jgi:hypothetical protein
LARFTKQKPAAMSRSEILDAYSNSEAFESVSGDTLLLYYAETADETDVRFDGDNDERLLAIFSRSPYLFRNDVQLAEYEALVSRATYECRAHPQQREAAEFVANALEPPDDPESLVVFVYRRDSASTSAVRNRRASPFTNSTDGTTSTTPARVVLFRQYSHEPLFVATLVWHAQVRRNASVGLVAFRIERVIGGGGRDAKLG